MANGIDPAVLLSSHPSFVVGSPGGAGLLCHLGRADPCCGDDREVAIVAEPVNVDASGNATPTGAASIDLRVGIDCGYLYFGKGGLVDTSRSPGMAALDAGLNGRALDALATRWLAERGENNQAGQQLPNLGELEWEPGMPLTWECVFKVLREDNFHGPRGCYAAFDMYFIDPDHDKPEVILHFGEGPHGPTKEVGGVRINLETSKVKFLQISGRLPLLKYLWARYQQRHPDFSQLEARWSKMRELGPSVFGK